MADKGPKGMIFDLFSRTMYHSKNLKLLDTSTPLLSLISQTTTGLDALRVRTTFYFSQWIAIHVSTTGDGWFYGEKFVEQIQRQTVGISSPELLAVAVLACTTVVSCELPKSVIDDVFAGRR